MGGRLESSSVGGWFPETQWSLVLAAQSNSDIADRALESLCRIYWKPVFAFTRAQGFSVADAEDLTQGFFERLLERDLLAHSGREKGRLRTFLAVALRNYLANAREYAGAVKRGGRVLHIRQDVTESEALLVVSSELTPDRVFDRHWALTLLGRVLARLQEECRRAGKQDLFEAFKSDLSGDAGAGNRAKLAECLEMSEGATRVAMHRMRNRYRELLVSEVAQTVGHESAVEDELRALLESV